MSYIRFETPKELIEKALDALESAKETGKVRKGTNEVTKAIEKVNAKLVVIGSDVDPPEIVMHLPMLCEEKGIPYLYATKSEIGDAVGIHVPTAAGCIVDEGKSKDIIAAIVEKLKGLKE